MWYIVKNIDMNEYLHHDVFWTKEVYRASVIHADDVRQYILLYPECTAIQVTFMLEENV